MAINWQVIAVKVLRRAEKLLRRSANRSHGKAVETINRNRLVQTRNPRSGQWIVIDREECEIVDTVDEPMDGVEVVE